MSVDPESIQVGQCYLMKSGKVRQVIAIYEDRVEFGTRAVTRLIPGWTWRRAMTDLKVFASMIERPVAENLTIENDEVTHSRSR
jgi:gentisate 1,2-dioxygenase